MRTMHLAEDRQGGSQAGTLQPEPLASGPALSSSLSFQVLPSVSDITQSSFRPRSAPQFYPFLFLSSGTRHRVSHFLKKSGSDYFDHLHHFLSH